MPAPSEVTYASAVIVAAHTEVLTAIDAGATAGVLRFYDDTDTELGAVLLTDPAGTVNGATGQLTITPDSAGSVTADGTCTYATITDSDATLIVSVPVQAGASPVDGYVVVNTTDFVSGASITVLSCTIG